VIAKRHDRFLQPIFYRLLAVVPACQEGDFFLRSICVGAGDFAAVGMVKVATSRKQERCIRRILVSEYLETPEE
jgi:hypothetical protein